MNIYKLLFPEGNHYFLLQDTFISIDKIAGASNTVINVFYFQTPVITFISCLVNSIITKGKHYTALTKTIAGTASEIRNRLITLFIPVQHRLYKFKHPEFLESFLGVSFWYPSHPWLRRTLVPFMYTEQKVFC